MLTVFWFFFSLIWPLILSGGIPVSWNFKYYTFFFSLTSDKYCFWGVELLKITVVISMVTWNCQNNLFEISTKIEEWLKNFASTNPVLSTDWITGTGSIMNLFMKYTTHARIYRKLVVIEMWFNHTSLQILFSK